MKKTATTLFLLLSFGFFLAGGTASADTVILPGSETPLIGPGGILDQLYGLANLQRVPDAIDTFWVPANGNATATAKFAAFTQNFGYIPDEGEPGFVDDSFQSLFTVPGGTNGIGLGGPSAVLNSGNVGFLWALNPSSGRQWTSLPSKNDDGLDHMVTWEITDTPNTWVIAWEDLNGGGDRDFNDLVVEVSLAPVPIPPAILLLGSGLVAMIGIRRRLKS